MSRPRAVSDVSQMFDMQTEGDGDSSALKEDNGMDVVDDTTRPAVLDKHRFCSLKQEQRLVHWMDEGEPYSSHMTVPQPLTKIALTLFKVQQSIYLLDFQRVEVREHCVCVSGAHSECRAIASAS